MSDLPFYEQMRGELLWGGTRGLEVPPEASKAFNNAMGAWIFSDAHGFCMPPESGDGHCDPNQFVRTIGLRVDELWNAYNSHLTQSPIEDMLLGALLWLDSELAGFPRFDVMGDGPVRRDDGTYTNVPGMSLWVTAQAPIAGYKADFLLWMTEGSRMAGIVVECDGHAFHERTKEQAARDKKRDREILAAGYPVLRFTGSEVFKDPAACVEQIKGVLFDVGYGIYKAGRGYA